MEAGHPWVSARSHQIHCKLVTMVQDTRIREGSQLARWLREVCQKEFRQEVGMTSLHNSARPEAKDAPWIWYVCSRRVGRTMAWASFFLPGVSWGTGSVDLKNRKQEKPVKNKKSSSRRRRFPAWIRKGFKTHNTHTAHTHTHSHTAWRAVGR